MGRQSAYKRVRGKEHFKLLLFISIQSEHGERKTVSELFWTASLFVCFLYFFTTSLSFNFYVYGSIHFNEYDKLDHLHDYFGRCS